MGWREGDSSMNSLRKKSGVLVLATLLLLPAAGCIIVMPESRYDGESEIHESLSDWEKNDETCME